VRRREEQKGKKDEKKGKVKEESEGGLKRLRGGEEYLSMKMRLRKLHIQVGQDAIRRGSHLINNT
jgi:hypothetical protein